MVADDRCGSESEPASRVPDAVLGPALLVALFGLALRLLHHATLLASPLYWHPLGGHVVFLETAAQILGGDLLPGSRPFVENSPLYPYVLAAVWAVVGKNFLVARLLTMLADAGTIVLVTLLGSRHFGRRAGIAAGLLYAIYAPAIFFSTQLIYTPYAVLLSTLAVWCIEGTSKRSAVAAGIATGLAIDLMPSAILGAPLVVLTPLVARLPRARLRGTLAAVAIGIAIAPVTIANWLNSGELVLLTTSFGHSLYVGHNPAAQAGYKLPTSIGSVPFTNRGTIFDNMQAAASAVAGRPLADTEVSPFYVRRALEHVATHPAFELRLAAARLAALVNDYEATTYGDFYFEEQTSAVLRLAPMFGPLFALAVLGIVGTDCRRNFALIVPILTATATVLAFYYLARFRMPMTPMLCVFAGHGIVRSYVWLGAGSWRPAFGAAVAGLALLAFARIGWVRHDSANEWNKLGAVWMSLGKSAEAETAFDEARHANPQDPSAYLNLARLYDRRGDAESAAAILLEGSRHLGGHALDDARRKLSAAIVPPSHP